MHRPLTAAALLSLGLLLPGCWGERRLEPTPVERTPETVRLTVVGDPGLAEAIRRLKGEWHAVSGNTLEVTASQCVQAAIEKPGGHQRFDAVILAAHDLGAEVERGTIVPVRREVRDDPAVGWNDFFLLVQQGVNWGDDVWGVPLGQPPLILLYRRDLFERFEKSPPATWTEYQKLVEFFAKRENLADAASPADAPWHATLEPTDPGWGGRLLLARAAAYAKHRDNFSTLFNIDTMQPLIAGEPFVRALDELEVAGGKESPRLDPAGVREAFFAGQSAMALTWPTGAKSPAAGDDRDEPAESLIQVGFAELPGATQMYNFASGKWDNRSADESVHVPVVPLAGLTGVVLKDSAHAGAAFDLLAFLASEKWATRVASKSDRTTLFRHSQQAEAARWVESSLDQAAARQYAEVVGDSLSRTVWVDGLRIPLDYIYYDALNKAVAAALDGTATSREALVAAAKAWSETTEEVGLDRQKSAYRRSLGLEP